MNGRCHPSPSSDTTPSSPPSRQRRRSMRPAPPSSATPTASGGCRRRSTSTLLRTATSARCLRSATGSRSSSGLRRFRRTRPGATPPSPAPCSSPTPTPASSLPFSTALLVSTAATGELLAVLDCAAVTSLRTGAAAAVSSQVLAPAEARTVGLVGCGVNGGWVGRCLAAAGYGPGVCSDPRSEVATGLAEELGWTAGSRDDAVAQDIVATVTPGAETVISSADPRSGQHLIALGADAAGKSEVDLDALEGCELFCDEWAQASRGGELASAVSEGMVTREDVTEIGAVITGSAEGRSSAEAVTLFDSTGLAIQDLGIAAAALAALREGRVEADAHVDL